MRFGRICDDGETPSNLPSSSPHIGDDQHQRCSNDGDDDGKAGGGGFLSESVVRRVCATLSLVAPRRPARLPSNSFNYSISPSEISNLSKSSSSSATLSSDSCQSSCQLGDESSSLACDSRSHSSSLTMRCARGLSGGVVGLRGGFNSEMNGWNGSTSCASTACGSTTITTTTTTTTTTTSIVGETNVDTSTTSSASAAVSLLKNHMINGETSTSSTTSSSSACSVNVLDSSASSASATDRHTNSGAHCVNGVEQPVVTNADISAGNGIATNAITTEETSTTQLEHSSTSAGSTAALTSVNSTDGNGEAERLRQLRQALVASDGWSCANVNQNTAWQVPASPPPVQQQSALASSQQQQQPMFPPPLPNTASAAAAIAHWKQPGVSNGTEGWHMNATRAGSAAGGDMINSGVMQQMSMHQRPPPLSYTLPSPSSSLSSHHNTNDSMFWDKNDDPQLMPQQPQGDVSWGCSRGMMTPNSHPYHNNNNNNNNFHQQQPQNRVISGWPQQNNSMSRRDAVMMQPPHHAHHHHAPPPPSLNQPPPSHLHPHHHHHHHHAVKPAGPCDNALPSMMPYHQQQHHLQQKQQPRDWGTRMLSGSQINNNNNNMNNNMTAGASMLPQHQQQQQQHWSSHHMSGGGMSSSSSSSSSLPPSASIAAPGAGAGMWPDDLSRCITPVNSHQQQQQQQSLLLASATVPASTPGYGDWNKMSRGSNMIQRGSNCQLSPRSMKLVQDVHGRTASSASSSSVHWPTDITTNNTDWFKSDDMSGVAQSLSVEDAVELLRRSSVDYVAGGGAVTATPAAAAMMRSSSTTAVTAPHLKHPHSHHLHPHHHQFDGQPGGFAPPSMPPPLPQQQQQQQTPAVPASLQTHNAAQQQQHQLNPLIQQIHTAVAAGHLNPAILKQPLAPPTLLLLKQLLSLIGQLEQLSRQQQNASRMPQPNRVHLQQLHMEIVRVKTLLGQTQNQISAQQSAMLNKQQTSVRGESGAVSASSSLLLSAAATTASSLSASSSGVGTAAAATAAMLAHNRQQQHHQSVSAMSATSPASLNHLAADFSDISLLQGCSSAVMGSVGAELSSGSTATGAGDVCSTSSSSSAVVSSTASSAESSRLSQWVLPPTLSSHSADRQVGHEFSRAPGTGSTVAGATPGSSIMPVSSVSSSSLSVTAAGPPSSSSSCASSLVMTTSNDGGYQQQQQQQHQPSANMISNLADLVPEFQPGKPWRGPHNRTADEDPTLTPGSWLGGQLSSSLNHTAAANVSSSTQQVSHASTAMSAVSGDAATLANTSWQYNGARASSSKWGMMGGGGDNGGDWPSMWGNSSASCPTSRNSVHNAITHHHPHPHHQEMATWGAGAGTALSSTNTAATSSCWLLLRNLTPQMDVSTVRTLCMQHGPVLSFHAQLNQHGVAIVRYGNMDEAIRACNALHQCVLSGSQLQCDHISEQYALQLASSLHLLPSSSSSSSSDIITAAASPASSLLAANTAVKQPPAFAWDDVATNTHTTGDIMSGWGGGGGGVNLVWGDDSIGLTHLGASASSILSPPS